MLALATSKLSNSHQRLALQAELKRRAVREGSRRCGSTSGARLAVTVPNDLLVLARACKRRHGGEGFRHHVARFRADRMQHSCGWSSNPGKRPANRLSIARHFYVDAVKRPIIGSITLSEVGRSMPAPSGPDCSTCVPDSSQMLPSEAALWFVVEEETEKKKLQIDARPREPDPKYSPAPGCPPCCRQRTSGDRFHPAGRVLRCRIGAPGFAANRARRCRAIRGRSRRGICEQAIDDCFLRRERATRRAGKTADAKSRGNIDGARLTQRGRDCKLLVISKTAERML